MAGHILEFLTSEQVRRIPVRDIEASDALRAAVWALHWWMPEPPDTPDWHRWLREEDPRLVQALAGPEPASTGRADRAARDVERREFRDRLAQTAFARARLRGAREVEAVDLERTIDSLVRASEQAAAWSRTGRGPLRRLLDRSEGARTARLRRTLELLFQERPGGLTVEEAVAVVGSGGALPSTWDVENQLERLRIRGFLFQDKSGRYRVA
jgi:hypothetical protein